MKILEGSYGIVYFTNDYAIKKFKKDAIHAFYVELFYLSILRKNFNVCKIVDIDFQNKTITMNKYEGNLQDLALVLNFEKRISLSHELIKQIHPVINILHSRGINHSDITPRNIFYLKTNEEYNFFLGDFSRTSVRNEEKTYSKNFGNNFLYIDPDKSSTNVETDLWCFGITIYQFILNNFNSDQLLDLNKIEMICSNNHLKHFLDKTGKNRKVVENTNPFFDSNNRNLTYHVRNMEKTGLNSILCNNIFNIAMNNEHFDDKIVLQMDIKISGKKIINALNLF